MTRNQLKGRGIVLFSGFWLLPSMYFYVQAQKNITVSLFGMPERTYMHGSSPYDNVLANGQAYFPEESKIQRKPSYSYTLGFLCKKDLSPGVTIGWGFQYAPAEQKYKTILPGINKNIESSIRLKYVKLPVYVQYNYWVRKKQKLFIATGPQLHILIAENGEIPVYILKDRAPVFDLIDPGGAYRNFAVGGLFTTGIQFEPDDQVGVFFACYIDATFTPVERNNFVHLGSYINDIYGTPNATIRTTHIITAGLMMGFVFRVKNTSNLP